MAKRDITSKARRSRNLQHETTAGTETTSVARSDQPSTGNPTSQSDPAHLAEVVSDERMRLMKAQAVLGCVTFALLYEDWQEEDERPAFSLAVAVIQDLVTEAIERLSTSS